MSQRPAEGTHAIGCTGTHFQNSEEIHTTGLRNGVSCSREYRAAVRLSALHMPARRKRQRVPLQSMRTTARHLSFSSSRDLILQRRLIHSMVASQHTELSRARVHANLARAFSVTARLRTRRMCRQQFRRLIGAFAVPYRRSGRCDHKRECV